MSSSSAGSPAAAGGVERVGRRQRLLGGGERAAAGVEVAGAVLDGEHGQQAVAQEFQHLAMLGRDGLADHLQMLIEPGHHAGGWLAAGEAREPAQVGEQDRRLDRAAGAAPHLACQHAPRGALAEIDAEDRRS